MKTYTIAGYYPDNNHPAVNHVEAETPRAALLALPAKIVERTDEELDMDVCAIFEGAHVDLGPEADELLSELTYTVRPGMDDEEEEES